MVRTTAPEGGQVGGLPRLFGGGRWEGGLPRWDGRGRREGDLEVGGRVNSSDDKGRSARGQVVESRGSSGVWSGPSRVGSRWPGVWPRLALRIDGLVEVPMEDGQAIRDQRKGLLQLDLIGRRADRQALLQPGNKLCVVSGRSRGPTWGAREIPAEGGARRGG
jgi:hypothetical protein